MPRLLAPCDLQAIKAAGVTFVASALERVIEEQARGDASRADGIRVRLQAILGDNVATVRPGSPEAARIKQVLIEQGAWSQYLEVGIGPDAEIFTKTQPMAAVGLGSLIGLHPKSTWNNPEPEAVLAVNSRGDICGATLGNDVNLRDFEGRSALLLGKAKDNNASCAIGPFFRLFDADFSIDDVRNAEIVLDVHGNDGFHMNGASAMRLISRDPTDLVARPSTPRINIPMVSCSFSAPCSPPSKIAMNAAWDSPTKRATAWSSPPIASAHWRIASQPATRRRRGRSAPAH